MNISGDLHRRIILEKQFFEIIFFRYIFLNNSLKSEISKKFSNFAYPYRPISEEKQFYLLEGIFLKFLDTKIRSPQYKDGNKKTGSVFWY